MNRLDIVFEMVDLPEHGHDDNHTCHSGEDGPDDEVRTENGTVPQGLDRHGKDKGDDRVNRDHDRDHQGWT